MNGPISRGGDSTTLRRLLTAQHLRARENSHGRSQGTSDRGGARQRGQSAHRRVFAVDSAYQSPEVIRALYCAVRALETAGGGARAGRGRRRATPANRGPKTKTVCCYRLSTAAGRSRSWRRRTAARAAAFRHAWCGMGGWRRKATGRSAGRASGDRGTRTQPVLVSCAMPHCTIPRSYAQRFPSRQHHRQVERRRPGSRHRPACGRDCGPGGHRVNVTLIDDGQAKRRRSPPRSSRRAHGSRGAARARRPGLPARTST